MTIDAALRELETLLPGLNYVVAFDLHRVPAIPDGGVNEYVATALGPEAEVGGIAEITRSELLAEVEQCIRWPGDIGSGPDKKAIRSSRLDELVTCVLSHLERMTSDASVLWQFWLKKGHPFYPVHWDFAYVMVSTERAEVLIGSSSD